MRRSIAFKRIAWLVVAALVAQSWLGQLATSAVSAEVDGIVICTSTGFEIVSLPDGLGPPANASEMDDGHLEHDPDYTACLVQAAAKALTDLAESSTPWHWPDAVTAIVLEAQPTSPLSHRAHPSRAPPSV